MSLSSVKHHADAGLITSGASSSDSKFSQLYVNKINDRESRKLRRRTLGFGENLTPHFLTPSYLSKNTNKNTNIADLIYNYLHLNASTTNNNTHNLEINNNLNVLKNENTEINTPDEENNNISIVNINATSNNAILNYQLHQAKEMGYTDAEILEMFKINNNVVSETDEQKNIIFPTIKPEVSHIYKKVLFFNVI